MINVAWPSTTVYVYLLYQKAMMDNKGKAVKGLSGGIEFLFKKNKVSHATYLID